VYRSRFLPRFLGVWLAIDGFAYVIISLTSVLLPQYHDKVFIISQPALFGEVAFMFWLLIKGAKPPTLGATAPSSAVRLHFVGCRAIGRCLLVGRGGIISLVSLQLATAQIVPP
jgi:hypothetical protein